jgi:hypothetical protein
MGKHVPWLVEMKNSQNNLIKMFYVKDHLRNLQLDRGPRLNAIIEMGYVSVDWIQLAWKSV